MKIWLKNRSSQKNSKSEIPEGPDAESKSHDADVSAITYGLSAPVSGNNHFLEIQIPRLSDHKA